MHLMSILSGILIGTSYIPFPPWALLFCLAPLWYILSRVNTIKKVFFYSFITQFVLTLIGMHWVTYTAHIFGGFNFGLSTLIMIVFAATAHLYYPIAACIWFYLKNKFKLSNTQSLFLIPSIHFLCESFYPSIFPWHLGYPWLWAELPIYQIADTIGFEGLNLLTLYLNAFVLWVVLNLKNKQLIKKPIVYVIFTLAFLFCWGVLKQKKWSSPESDFRITSIQANLTTDQAYKVYGSDKYVDKVLEKYFNLTQKAIDKDKLYENNSLIFWPETAMPFFMDEHKKTFQKTKVINFLNKNNVDVLTGAYSQQKDSKTQYVGIFLKNANESKIQTYRKRHLLAFGEYLPGASIFPKLKSLLPMVANFAKGEEINPFIYKDIKIGSQICYEGLFTDISGVMTKKGAHILANITNDSWYGTPFEPLQHLYMTLARAIEFRRPLVRVTNTGISTAILADGTILAASKSNEEWFHTYNIKFHKDAPFSTYQYLYKYFKYILFLLVLSLLGYKYVRTKKS